MTPVARHFAALLACVLLVACGGAAAESSFSTNWQNDHGESIARLQQRLSGVVLPPGKGVAVGVTDTGLVAVTLDGASTWSSPVRPDTLPAIAGNVVIVTGGRELIALDSSKGRQLWSIPNEGKVLLGAGDDGRLTVATLASAAGGGSLLLAIDRTGKVVLRLEPQVDVGVPAVLDGVAFVPWGNQYVSAIDVTSGREIGRLLARILVSRAIGIGGTLYFGETALMRFDSAIGRAESAASHTVTLPERELPGKPRWYPSGVEAREPVASATDSIRLYARPAGESGPADIESERVAATYFRIVLGLNSTDGSLRWVQTLPAGTIGGAAATGGFGLCDEKGDVWLIGARRGGHAGKVSMGKALRACAVSPGDFVIEDVEQPKSVPEQIAAAVEVEQTDMVSIQRFLLRELGTNQDPTVTRLLIELASDARTSPALVDDTRNLLAARRSGAEYMLKALQRQYDFLSDVLRPPPVGPIADALAAMREQRAAPLLAAQLNEPTLSTDDIQRAARALVVLATANEAEELRTFFSLYRAAASDDQMVAAVISIARAFLNVGGEEALEIVNQAANDPLTNSAVRQGITSLLPTTG